MQTSGSLIFFGNERLSSGFLPDGAPTLQTLIDHGYAVKAVVAHHQGGQSRTSRALEIEAVARTHNIPVLLPDRPQDAIEELKSYHADAGVLVAYGRIIPQSVIDIFPRGILNMHPSLLPRYRGPTPIEQAILDGAAEAGVSIMGLSRGMDEGPIYAQQRVALDGTETKTALTQKLLLLGGELIIETLPAVLKGEAHPQSQDSAQATYSKLIHKSDGDMDLSKPAERLEREVRAYAIWPKSRLTLAGNQVIATKTRVAQRETGGGLFVCCNPGYLEILELIAPSGKTMRGEDFKRGYLRN